MIPATRLRAPATCAAMLIVTLDKPVAGQVTVVDGSPGVLFAAQPAVELPALNVTAGVKIAVTVRPLAPAVPPSAMRKEPGVPTAGLEGGVMPVTDRST
jgi:hypothetical protein